MMNISARPEVHSVSDVTRRIKYLLEDHVGSVWIEGEISNLSQPSSGHMYLVLKDEAAQIKAALFRGNQRGLKILPANGMQVRVYGDISVYEKSGTYQIIIRQMEEAGKGSLQEAFEKLKKKLEEEGLFARERKQKLPLLPRHIGIVTSPTGAAVRDMLKVISRRFPNIHIVIAPVRVQGEGAAQEIADAIAALNRLGGIDTIIAGRGGGSIEDLWCFNEECVARAIAASDIPVISAVGHETDFTISDFTADLRAPTPSAAAELVVASKDSFEQMLGESQRRLIGVLERRYLQLKHRVVKAQHSYVFREPQNLIQRYFRQIDHIEQLMLQKIGGFVQTRHQYTDNLHLRLSHLTERSLDAVRQRVAALRAQLRVLNPHAVLERGYSVTRGPSGKIIRQSDDVEPGVEINTQLAHGQLISKVFKINSEE